MFIGEPRDLFTLQFTLNDIQEFTKPLFIIDGIRCVMLDLLGMLMTRMELVMYRYVKTNCYEWVGETGGEGPVRHLALTCLQYSVLVIPEI